MTKEEKLNAYSWLLDMSEAYKTMTKVFTWDSGDPDEPKEVKSANCSTGGVHLWGYFNGEYVRELVSELGLFGVTETDTKYENDTIEVSFVFNGVKFFWLEEKEEDDA